MIHQQKLQIRDALLRYISNFSSEAQAAKNLEGLSASTITKIKNYNWESLNDEQWQALARQVGFYCGEWQAANTSTYTLLRILFSDAKHYTMVYGIAISAGLGKTFSAKMYCRENTNTCYIAGSELHNRKAFITELLKNFTNETKEKVPEMMQQLCDHLAIQDEPLLIIDDAHKLKDRVLHFVISLTDCLSGLCGMVIMGNEELRDRILKGVKENTEGFETIYKTIGRSFISLAQMGPNDVKLICQANNVKDENRISYIKEQCKNNLRPIAQLVQEIAMQSDMQELIAA